MDSFASATDTHSTSDIHHLDLHPQLEEIMANHLADAQTVLQQPPPPSLVQILAAYKTKGDGDRDLLMAMLNAKSSEDQRLASVASLQRTMLEIQQAAVLAQTQVLHTPGYISHPASPPMYERSRHSYSGYTSPRASMDERDSDRTSSSSQPHSTHSHGHRFSHLHDSDRYQHHRHLHHQESSSRYGAIPRHHPDQRKRQRLSRSPESPRDFPPSPCSSSSDVDPAPFRPAMEIGSLVSRREDDDGYSGSRPHRTSSNHGQLPPSNRR